MRTTIYYYVLQYINMYYNILMRTTTYQYILQYINIYLYISLVCPLDRSVECSH